MLQLNYYRDPDTDPDSQPPFIPDIPLIIPTDELAAWIEASIDPRDLTTWLLRAFPGPGLSKIAWPTGFPLQRKVQINRLIWPNTASRWAYMSCLIDAGNLAALQDVAFDDDGFGFNALTLKLSSGVPGDLGYSEIGTRMYLLPPIPLSSVKIASDPANPFLPNQDQVNNLYLIQLVDDRFFWWSLSTNDVVTRGMTWTALFEALGDIIDEDIEVDDIPAEYLTVGEDMVGQYEVLPPLLDAAAYNVGQRICVFIDGNVVHSQGFDLAKSALVNFASDFPNNTTRAGDRWYKDTSAL